MRTEARVLEVIPTTGRMFLKLELLSGEVVANEALRSSSAEVQVRGVAFSPPAEWHRGVRLISVELVRGDMPAAGTILVGQ